MTLFARLSSLPACSKDRYGLPRNAFEQAGREKKGLVVSSRKRESNGWLGQGTYLFDHEPYVLKAPKRNAANTQIWRQYACEHLNWYVSICKREGLRDGMRWSPAGRNLDTGFTLLLQRLNWPHSFTHEPHIGLRPNSYRCNPWLWGTMFTNNLETSL